MCHVEVPTSQNKGTEKWNSLVSWINSLSVYLKCKFCLSYLGPKLMGHFAVMQKHRGFRNSLLYSSFSWISLYPTPLHVPFCGVSSFPRLFLSLGRWYYHFLIVSHRHYSSCFRYSQKWLKLQLYFAQNRVEFLYWHALLPTCSGKMMERSESFQKVQHVVVGDR